MDGDGGRKAGEESLLTQFRPDFFLPHRPWLSLERILRTKGGGSYGLAGPRGAGKTWMMKNALRHARDRDGIGVWFPSPSEYEPTAFLAALSDVVATRYQRYYDKRTRRATSAANSRFFRGVAGAMMLLLAAALWWLLVYENGTAGPNWLIAMNAIWVILFAFAAFLLARATARFFQEQRGLGKVRSEAEELREQVRYTVSSSENAELGLDAGYGGLKGVLKRARERKLVERPATLSSLIHNFRSFAEAMADEFKGPTVIAIDELDKMSDPSRVAQLFRDIKGIFEIPGVYFLVSLSDEAARALDLGGVRTRNEFNSSFYTVISLPRLSPEQCVELLKKRDPAFDRASGVAIGILCGGVSREVVRVGELTRTGPGQPNSVHEALRVAIEEELNAFGDQVLELATLAEEMPVSDAARVQFFDQLDGFKSVLDKDAETFAEASRRGWALNGSCSGWRAHLEEEWRRVLVRLAIAWYIESNPELLDDEAATARLQGIAKTAAGSAAVGRSSLEAFLAGERRLPAAAAAEVGTAAGNGEDVEARVRLQLSLPGGRRLWLIQAR